MSAESAPISAEEFRQAVGQLPGNALEAELARQENIKSHLTRSNAELKAFIGKEGGEMDRECRQAIEENEVVIGRIKERQDMVETEMSHRPSRS